MRYPLSLSRMFLPGCLPWYTLAFLQRPELAAITARITHANSKLKKADESMKAVERDLVKAEEKQGDLQKEYDGVEKAESRHKGSCWNQPGGLSERLKLTDPSPVHTEALVKAAKAKGKVLSDDEIKEYHALYVASPASIGCSNG